jgi:hypothetical protein
MQRLTYSFFVLLMMSLLFSCSRRKAVMSKEELKAFVRNGESGLVQEREVGELKARLQYQPSSLMVAQELGEGSEAKDKKLLDSLQKKYKGSYYFLLSFSVKGKEAIRQLGSFEKYSDMVSVLSFEMPRFVNLTTERRDTVELKDYYFDQTYGMSSSSTVLLAFDKQKIKESSSLQVNLAECGFGVGALKFSFNKQDLDQIPALDYSTL